MRQQQISQAQLILARTMYGEARGEGDQGMIAVGHVILNRANSQAWYNGGGSVVEAALQPWQFSTWNANDPNRPIIEAMSVGDNAVFDRAFELAGLILNGSIVDPTNGATHYHASWVSPDWAQTGQRVAQIGDHTFYSGVA